MSSELMFNHRLILCRDLVEGMTMLVEDALVLVEDVHPVPAQGVIDVKLNGEWAYYDDMGKVTIAEDIKPIDQQEAASDA